MDEPAVPEPEEEIGDGAPEMLRVLRWAVRNLDARCKGTPQEEHYRRLHKKQPIKFAELFAKLDREFRQAVAKAAPGGAGPPEPDEGTERALALCENLLGEFHKEEARKNADLAARPDAAAIGATLQHSLKCAVERNEVLEGLVADLEAKVRRLGGNPRMHIDSPEFFNGVNR